MRSSHSYIMKTLLTVVLSAMASVLPFKAYVHAADIIDYSSLTTERRLSVADKEHGLTNVNVWSRDSKWVGYDVRVADGALFNAVRLEMANIESGERRILYEGRNGAGCGVLTFSPVADLAAFILGPENPTKDWTYAFSRRRGMIVDVNAPRRRVAMDAMTYAPPFVPGALRGGSHVHVFSPDGKWISFTYDDDMLVRLDEAAANGQMVPGHDVNQRNVAVAVSGQPVRVGKSHPRNHDGTWFSAVVTRTVNKPRPGSDDISRAFEEGWIGTNGYIKSDGSRQKRALAFQGLVTAANGAQHAEVFVVDIPDDITVRGNGLLEGSACRRPAPPRGTNQRRVTYTDGSRFPGLTATPRHWLRSSPDGEAIAFVHRDDAGIAQLWTVSPRGGAPRQMTYLVDCRGISSAFTWSTDGKWLSAIIDGSVCIIECQTGVVRRLTQSRKGGDSPLELVSVFSTDRRFVAYMRGFKMTDVYYPHIYVVNVPEFN